MPRKFFAALCIVIFAPWAVGCAVLIVGIVLMPWVMAARWVLGY